MAFIRRYEARDKEACGEICIATLPPSLSTAPDPRVQKLAPYVWTHQFTFLSPETCHVLDDGAGQAVGYCIGCPDVYAMQKGYGRFVDEVLTKDAGIVGSLSGGEDGDGGLWRGKGEKVAWSVMASDDGGSGGSGGEGGKMVVNHKALEQLAFREDLLLVPPTPVSISGSSAAAAADAKTEMRPLSEYRATMHIDLLDSFQGKGWGRRLIDTFVESVREQVRIAREGVGKMQGMGGGEGKGGGEGEEEEEKPDYGAGIWIGVSPENRKVLSFYDRVGFRLVMNDDAEGIVLVRDV